ncbi:hypothetical protein NDU88_008736 [Pleurodeles waltl]|uniref:Uncharacterized protein n=1 Tax=Pleurodeles waltl TaxID=8319 RepID=A0AAV7QPH7_PLEWA|nr:hypothetical protein NDU88_008736 [Pleurodeles waltl]
MGRAECGLPVERTDLQRWGLQRRREDVEGPVGCGLPVLLIQPKASSALVGLRFPGDQTAPQEAKSGLWRPKQRDLACCTVVEAEPPTMLQLASPPTLR